MWRSSAPRSASTATRYFCRLALLAAQISGFAVLAGCVQDTSGTETGNEGGTGCAECASGQYGPIACECQTAPGVWTKHDGDTCLSQNTDMTAYCNSVCAPLAGEGADPACASTNVVGCSTWNPSAQISKVGTTYNVNKAWLTALIANSDPLWGCDDATLVPLADHSGFQVAGASAGEALYLLGLRNGDKPLTLNGKPLSSFADGAKAYELWLEGVTAYVLRVRRGTTIVTINIALV